MTLYLEAEPCETPLTSDRNQEKQLKTNDPPTRKKGNLHSLLVGLQTTVASMEASLESSKHALYYARRTQYPNVRILAHPCSFLI